MNNVHIQYSKQFINNQIFTKNKLTLVVLKIEKIIFIGESDFSLVQFINRRKDFHSYFLRLLRLSRRVYSTPWITLNKVIRVKSTEKRKELEWNPTPIPPTHPKHHFCDGGKSHLLCYFLDEQLYSVYSTLQTKGR